MRTIAIWMCALSLLHGAARLAPAQSDIDSVKSEQHAVGDDAHQIYFLINAHPEAPDPDRGHGLVMVLPGGDGSAEFNPFIRRIAKYAVPDGFLVVQLVAPKWRPQQQIVWPTQRLPDAAQQFTTEEFIAAALEDVRALKQIDDDRIWLMGWSSSGPVVYTMACAEKTPFTGFYAAMSVFKPPLLPPIANAKGRRIVIEHSPDDQVCPFAMAEQARGELTAAGAQVQFEIFEGGHGWRGMLFPRMRKAFEFLGQAREPESASQPEPAK